MARYIDADKAVERLRDICAPYEESREVKDEAIEIITDFPTADVAEVKHGKWVCVNNDENVWMCDGDDGCGTTIQIIEGTPTDNCFDFCHACGAKMDLEEE